MRSLIKKILKEARVPRDERIELYRDNNIIVVFPLTHRALQKYASFCQWCINDDKSEWEGQHKGQHVVIIQRNPKKSKKGITGMETEGEILILSRLDAGYWTFKDANEVLNNTFDSEEEALDYFVDITNDINNFGTNIVYYSPENGIYDMEDNFLWNFGFEISDIPNVTPEVVEIMDDFLNQNIESINESDESLNWVQDILPSMPETVKGLDNLIWIKTDQKIQPKISKVYGGGSDGEKVIVTNYKAYWNGHLYDDIWVGSEKELTKYINNKILSTYWYNKFKVLPKKPLPKPFGQS